MKILAINGTYRPKGTTTGLTEAALEGRKPTPQVFDDALTAASGEISPIDDVRGCAEYRRALVGIFLKRMLAEAAS